MTRTLFGLEGTSGPSPRDAIFAFKWTLHKTQLVPRAGSREHLAWCTCLNHLFSTPSSLPTLAGASKVHFSSLFWLLRFTRNFLLSFVVLSQGPERPLGSAG